MPATEQTWRDNKVMHIIFGASTVAMAIATLWMLAEDHNREWKDWQLTNRKKEAWMIRAQRDELADQLDERVHTYARQMRAAQTKPIDQALIDNFKSLVVAENDRLALPQSDFSQLDAAVESLKQGKPTSESAAAGLESAGELILMQDKAIENRESLIAQLAAIVDEARRREKQLVVGRKFVAADRTAAVSEMGLMVGGGASKKEKAKVQDRIQGFSERIVALTEEIAAAKSYRMGLESNWGEMDAELTQIAENRDSLKTELARLDDQAYKSTTNSLEWMTRWPVLDALYDGNVRIDQIWLPDLTINFNFSHVARFDRCKTCHQAISQTAPGSATEPGYPTFPKDEREVGIRLATPEAEPEDGSTLRDVYGLVLAKVGMMNYADVTVKYVLPDSSAAVAGLQSGDLILNVGDVPVYENAMVENFLLSQVDWGETASLTIRRGLDHPFTTHPRLDLYLSDSSPHPEKEVGCTICHDGQGSGTEFPWTSHTPNDAEQQVKWAREHGWFDNHHWIFPMKPARFVESNCLKCHHEKGDLQPSERFPEPPAEKLIHGWTLVEKYGCFGCHEMNGYDGPDKRIGPDIRLAPNFSEVAAQVMRDEQLSEEQRLWAQTLIERPENNYARNQLFTAIKQDAKLASKSETAVEAKLSPATHKLADGLKNVGISRFLP